MQNLTLANEDLNIIKRITSSTQWKAFTAMWGVQTVLKYTTHSTSTNSVQMFDGV